MFVIPKLYHQYSQLLYTTLVTNPQTPHQTTPEAIALMKYYWKEISARNETFCGSVREVKSEPIEEVPNTLNHLFNLGESKNDVDEEEQLILFLDDVGLTIDSGVGLQIDGANNNEWKDIRGWTASSVCAKIFGSSKRHDDTQALYKKVETLCTWATTTARHGDWRAYLVSSVLCQFIEGMTEEPSQVDEPEETHNNDHTEQTRRNIVQESLMSFLDQNDITDKESLSEDESDMDIDHGK